MYTLTPKAPATTGSFYLFTPKKHQKRHPVPGTISTSTAGNLEQL